MAYNLSKEEFSKVMRNETLQNFKSTPYAKLLYEKGISIRFVYKDYESSLLADFTILPSEYK